MIAQVRAELLRQRSVRTGAVLVLAMVALVLLIILLHALELRLGSLARSTTQLSVMGEGQRMGTLFAALFGALSITSEFRYGTIRPIFLATPHRGRVIAAKVAVGMLFGALLGLTATGVSAAVGSAVLLERGLTLQVTAGEYALLLAGGAAGGMLWSAIGVGVGAVVRNQVPAMVGLCTWLLFVEGLLFGDIGLSKYGRLLPGALAQAAAGLGQQTLLAPGPAVVLLSVYALAASIVGWTVTNQGEVA